MNENLKAENSPKISDNDFFEDKRLYERIMEKIKKDGKKDCEFENGKIFILGNDIFYVKEKEGTKKRFLEGSRIFYFTNEKEGINQKQLFIHDQKSLDLALNLTKIKNGILKIKAESQNDLETNENYDSNKPIKSDNSNKSKKSDDSLKSEKSDDSNKSESPDISNISLKSNDSNKSKSSNNLSNTSSSLNDMNIYNILKSSYNLIEESKNIKVNKILNAKNYNNRYEISTISCLDFNFKKLKGEYLKNEAEYLDNHITYYNYLNDLIYNNDKSYCYIFGPKGTGKTTLLLRYLNLMEIPRLYFSLNIMKQLNLPKKLKKYSLYETLYAFNSLKQMEDFSKMDINNKCNHTNLMEFIKSYIELIYEFFSKNQINSKIWIVIDDYNQELFDKEGIIEKIINYIQKFKNDLFLCILGNGKYINKKMYQYFSNEVIDFTGFYWNQTIENKISDKNKILKVPKYYYEYKDSKDIKIAEKNVEAEIEKEFQKYKLNSFIFLNKYIDMSIDLKIFEDEIITLPLEYLTVQKIIDEEKKIYLKLSFNSEIYKIVYVDTIKSLLKIDNLMTNKKYIFNDDNKGKGGFDFEDIIVEQLWNNTFEFINFPPNNKIKVDNIYDLRFNETFGGKMVDPEKPIIIRQKDQGGKFYDLLLILRNEGKNYAIFIQIGLTKRGTDINRYLVNLTKNDKNYKNGITKLINCPIESIGFLLIFEYEHQKELIKENKKAEGYVFCKENKIEYLIYKNFQLFKNIDDNEPINSFNVKKNLLIYEDIEENNNFSMNMVIEGFSKLFRDLSAKNNSKSIKPLSDVEKSKILSFIKKNYNTDYDELDFAFTIIDDEGNGNYDFGRINNNNFYQIYVFIDKNAKYFSYNNNMYKLSSNKIEKSKKMYFENKLNWDIYFLKKKRNLNSDE